MNANQVAAALYGGTAPAAPAASPAPTPSPAPAPAWRQTAAAAPAPSPVQNVEGVLYRGEKAQRAPTAAPAAPAPVARQPGHAPNGARRATEPEEYGAIKPAVIEPPAPPPQPVAPEGGHIDDAERDDLFKTFSGAMRSLESAAELRLGMSAEEAEQMAAGWARTAKTVGLSESEMSDLAERGMAVAAGSIKVDDATGSPRCKRPCCS